MVAGNGFKWAVVVHMIGVSMVKNIKLGYGTANKHNLFDKEYCLLLVKAQLIYTRLLLAALLQKMDPEFALKLAHCATYFLEARSKLVNLYYTKILVLIAIFLLNVVEVMYAWQPVDLRNACSLPLQCGMLIYVHIVVFFFSLVPISKIFWVKGISTTTSALFHSADDGWRDHRYCNTVHVLIGLDCMRLEPQSAPLG